MSLVDFLQSYQKMSTAKHRMRDKKMRNQPTNVTYSSQGSSHWRNGGDTPTGRGRDLSPHPWGQGSSHSGHAQGGGWVRGHQREGHGGYPQALPTHITGKNTFLCIQLSNVF